MSDTPEIPINARGNGRLRALLAEDDPDMRRLLIDLLEGLGAQVTAVEDGHGLVDLLEASTREPDELGFDLIVTDHRMPGATGASAVEVFRKYEPDAPVLVVSAFADDELAERVRGFGVAELLKKPFEPDAFLSSVERLLDRGRSAA